MEESAREELVAELAEEYLEQLRAGKAPSVEQFAESHPECRDDLLELLPTMVDMEGLSRTTTRPVINAMASFPGRLGGYRLLERIGNGGMGTVFRAEQEALSREVAVKILFPSWNTDARHCEAFENESKLIAGLHHTNIIEVFGAGHEGDYRYYVMSLVDGQGVSPACVRKSFPGISYEEAVARVGLQAAKALAYAHSQGVLHRDVKPGNMLLDAEGILHVGDFGLATVLNSGENAPLVTQSHDGTLRYMAPERLSRGENSFAGDQYALGLTLYELLMKRPAFREVEPGNLIHRICSEPLEPLRGEGELGAVINKSISFAPEDRYATMQEMAADLQRYLEGLPVKARPVSLLRRYTMWMHRRPAVALWSHVAAALVVLLFVSISYGYASVRKSLASENEQRLRAEKNARIADAALKRIFDSMVSSDAESALNVTKADARLLQDLMPYYEEIVAQADSGGGKDMATACLTLATIALQTGDAGTAQEYFKRAASLFAEDSCEYARAVNGQAMAMWSQTGYRPAAKELLQQLVKLIPDSAEAELCREKVRALLMLSMEGGRRFMPPVRNNMRENRRSDKHRQEYLLRAAELVAKLVAQHPLDEQARLWQLQLLSNAPMREVRELLAPEGETPAALLEQMLEQSPQSEAYRRTYVQQLLRPVRRERRNSGSAISTEMLKRACEYARDLLAEKPADSDLLLLYISVHDRYALSLSKQGKTQEAEREYEKTLGVLSLLTSRDDFTPEMRERLVMLVSMHPTEASARTQQEAEISLLLQKYDEKRMQELRSRMRQMRHRRYPWGASPRLRKKDEE